MRAIANWPALEATASAFAFSITSDDPLIATRNAANSLELVISLSRKSDDNHGSLCRAVAGSPRPNPICSRKG